MTGELTTAHEEWDRRWRDAAGRAAWSDASPEVVATIAELRDRGARRVLDVGSGVGRHALAFAAAGFEVTAVDAAPAGIAELERLAAAADVDVETHVAQFTALPVSDAVFDHLLAWNVLYHGDGEVVAAAFAECCRVLRPGGTFHFTMLSKRNSGFRRGIEIRPDTFVVAENPSDPDLSDKAHPHFYVDEAGLAALLTAAGFEPSLITDVDQRPPSGAFHLVAWGHRPLTGS